MKRLVLIVGLFLCVKDSMAQYIGRSSSDFNPVFNAYFYTLDRISNPRMGAFGEIGAVSSKFYFDAGLTQNPTGLVADSPYQGGSFTLNPEKSSQVTDFYLTDIKGFYSLGDRDFIGLNVRYFDLGEIQLTDENGERLSSENPYEYLIQGSWGHKFEKDISLGTSLKFIHSELGTPDQTNTIAIDFGFEMNKSLSLKDGIALNYAFGATINNLGTKVDYGTSAKYPMPTIIRLGFLINPEYEIEQDLTLNMELAYQIEKLLAPTPPIYEYNEKGERVGIAKGYDLDVSGFRALYQSFYDAPGGFSEEMHELVHKIGFEGRLNYADILYGALRLGKVFEHETKGISRGSIGLGAGAFGFTADLQFVNYDLQNGSGDGKTWIASVGYRSRIGEMFRF